MNRLGFGGDFLSWKDDLHVEAVPEGAPERAVRLVIEHRDGYETEYAAKLGIATQETLRQWVRRAEARAGQRPGVTSEDGDLS